MGQPITYYAHFILATGERIEFDGLDYEAVAADLDAKRQAILATEGYWPAGFVQSFR